MIIHKSNKIIKSVLCLILMWVSITTSAIEHVTYYHNDALGSPVAATDKDGNLLWREEYKPYGERIKDEAAGSNNRWFTGKQEESDFGISYFGARWYDPNVGRFMGIDPVGYTSKNDVMSFNRYLYVNNNPYKYTDPNGEFLNFIAGAVAGAVLDAAVQYATTGEVDFGQVAVSAAAGAVGVGVASKVATLIKAKSSLKITDGVRRAKAAEMADEKTIKAEIVSGNKVVKTANVKIKNLKSPKTEISTEGAGLGRMNRAIKNQAEGKVQPIKVERGQAGTPIKDVPIE